jgi:hypothetical protein
MRNRKNKSHSPGNWKLLLSFCYDTIYVRWKAIRFVLFCLVYTHKNLIFFRVTYVVSQQNNKNDLYFSHLYCLDWPMFFFVFSKKYKINSKITCSVFLLYWEWNIKGCQIYVFLLYDVFCLFQLIRNLTYYIINHRKMENLFANYCYTILIW